MGRKAKPTNDVLIARLALIKTMIATMAGALPTAAKELRREASELLDDTIADLR